MLDEAYFTINDYNLELFFNQAGIEYLGVVRVNEGLETLDFILEMDKLNSRIRRHAGMSHAKLLNKLKRDADEGLIARYALTKEQYKLTGSHDTRVEGVLKGVRNALYNESFVIKDGFPLKLPDTEDELFPYNKMLGCYLIPIEKKTVQKGIKDYMK